MTTTPTFGFTKRNDGFWWADPIDPSDVVDFPVSFRTLLGPEDTIDTANLSNAVNGKNITIENRTVFDTHGVTVWVKQGVRRTTAEVRITVNTTAGRTLERTFKIEVKDL
jgi:hypothetical protein